MCSVFNLLVTCNFVSSYSPLSLSLHLTWVGSSQVIGDGQQRTTTDTREMPAAGQSQRFWLENTFSAQHGECNWLKDHHRRLCCCVVLLECLRWASSSSSSSTAVYLGRSKIERSATVIDSLFKQNNNCNYLPQHQRRSLSSAGNQRHSWAPLFYCCPPRGVALPRSAFCKQIVVCKWPFDCVLKRTGAG